MIVLIKEKASDEDIQNASKEFGDYIKVVIDVSREIVLIGGRFHADAEKILVDQGSKHSDIWGGGYDMVSKKIETNALINIKPNFGNDNMEILDGDIRNKFLTIAKEKLL